MTAASIDSAPLSPLFAVGRTIAQRYTIQRHIGRGGMGDVYEAWDGELRVPVALKTLRLDRGRESDALRRLKREVLLARSIVHPSVCRVYDLGHDVSQGSDVWFLSMELLSGETLRARIRRLGRLPGGDVIRITDALAAALDAAHRSGVVHRDFKSENVLLTEGAPQERVVVLDFGLAHVYGEQDDDRTVEMDQHAIAGTPAYMAPEQVRGEVLGPPADIYALGVVLFEMTTGRLPFEAPTFAEVAVRRLLVDPPSPLEFAPELPRRWDVVIRRCLALDPRDRFARASDAADALAERIPTADIAPERIRADRMPSLPAERDTFVGREEETRALLEMLSGTSRVVTILGPGGVGKTRLALRVGRLAPQRTSGGIWLSDLTEAVTQAGIAAAVARALDVSLVVGDPVEQIGHAIAARGRCLLVLDNAEQVAALAAETIERWLDLAPDARFLVTSRERLHLQGESLWDLGPLPVDEGLVLLLDRVRLRLPAYDPSDAERAALREIVRLVDAMPLSIELAAGRLRMMSAPQLLERLGESLRALGGPGRGRHATLTTVLDGSWEHLHPWEQAALAQCSVFEGGFTIDAAEGVVDLSEWPDAPWTVDAMQSLVDKSLLHTQAADARSSPLRVAEVRLGMYVTIQEYARAKLRANGPGPTRAAEERHALWFARFGDRAFLESLDAHPDRWSALAQDRENLVAACRRAAAWGDADIATRAFDAANAVLFYTGPLATLVDIGRAVAQVSEGHPTHAATLITLGRVLWLVSGSAEARDLLGRALDAARAAGDRRSEADALREIGFEALWAGRLEEAREALTAAGAIRDGINDRRGRGNDHRGLGLVLQRMGQPGAAIQEFEAGLAAHQSSGNRRGEAVLHLTIGSLYMETGSLDAARVHYEQARAVYREIENRRGVALANGDIGNLHLLSGDCEGASTLFTEAGTILRQIGDPRNVAIMLGNLGDVRVRQERLEEARALYEESLAIHRDTKGHLFQAIQHGNIGMILLRAGDVEDARPHFDEALTLCAGDASGRLEGITLRYLVEWHRARGDRSAARATMTRSESLLRAAGDPIQLGVCLCVRAQLDEQDSDAAQARACLAEAVDLAKRSGAGSHSELGQRIDETRRIVPE